MKPKSDEYFEKAVKTEAENEEATNEEKKVAKEYVDIV